MQPHRGAAAAAAALKPHAEVASTSEVAGARARPRPALVSRSQPPAAPPAPSPLSEGPSLSPTPRSPPDLALQQRMGRSPPSRPSNVTSASASQRGGSEVINSCQARRSWARTIQRSGKAGASSRTQRASTGKRSGRAVTMTIARRKATLPMNSSGRWRRSRQVGATAVCVLWWPGQP